MQCTSTTGKLERLPAGETALFFTPLERQRHHQVGDKSGLGREPVAGVGGKAAHGRPCRQAWRQDQFLPGEARVGRWKLWTGSPSHPPATEEAKSAKRCCEGALTRGWCEGVDPRESRQETPDARGSSCRRRGNHSQCLLLSFSNRQQSKDTSCEVFSLPLSPPHSHPLQHSTKRTSAQLMDRD